MIKFIKPYFDNTEKEIFEIKPKDIDIFSHSIVAPISEFFGDTSFTFTQSGKQAILFAIQHAKKEFGWSSPTIAIPSVCCASVYRPAKQEGNVVLMDVGNDWNCVLDEFSAQADIILFASLNGKRIQLPRKQKKNLLYFCGQI